jgi:putative transposase
VHLIRHSLKYVPRKQYEQVTKDLRPIYTAIDADQAMHALEAFEEKWGKQIPVIGQAWRNAWEHVTPFMAFEPEVRRVIYTTNAIEALNRQLRKAIKTKGHFPTEDAARKLIYLAIGNAVPQWTRTRGWTKAMLAFKIHFGDRLPAPNPPTQIKGHPPSRRRAAVLMLQDRLGLSERRACRYVGQHRSTQRREPCLPQPFPGAAPSSGGRVPFARWVSIATSPIGASFASNSRMSSQSPRA